MKKRLTSIFALSTLIVLASCGGNNPITSSSSTPIESSSSLEASSNGQSSSSIIESSLESSSSSSLESSKTSSKSSSRSSSSQSSRSSSRSSSSSKSSSGNQTLSTTSGLVINFKATGASIDKITWNNKQIAKDGFNVGRVANRIANGKFSIDGTQYSVSVNANPHSLHGGAGTGMNSWRGPFATKDWQFLEEEKTDNSISYKIHSADGENGYPGNMDMKVTYTLSEAGELSIEYTATSDKDTLCNPTNHLFMALNGDTSYSNIKLWIDADNYTPLINQIPTGAIAPVAGTQFDYTTEKAFDGSKSYDDNYVLNGTGYRKVATMSGTTLGVKVDVYTDRPGLQLYKDSSGNICLETQLFPDMINHPEFDSYGTMILRKGVEFKSKTTYAFSAIEK